MAALAVVLQLGAPTVANARFVPREVQRWARTQLAAIGEAGALQRFPHRALTIQGRKVVPLVVDSNQGSARLRIRRLGWLAVALATVSLPATGWTGYELWQTHIAPLLNPPVTGRALAPELAVAPSVVEAAGKLLWQSLKAYPVETVAGLSAAGAVSAQWLRHRLERFADLALLRGLQAEGMAKVPAAVRRWGRSAAAAELVEVDHRRARQEQQLRIAAEDPQRAALERERLDALGRLEGDLRTIVDQLDP